MCEMRCDEEKATEEEKEKAAGTELKTKTPHSDVGNMIFIINYISDNLK